MEIKSCVGLVSLTARATTKMFIEDIAKISQNIYIVSRDAPVHLGGSMVTLYIQCQQDSFGNRDFGLLPMLREIVWYAPQSENSDVIHDFGQVDDHFVTMGHAVSCALEIAGEFHRENRNIYVINENGTSESTMCSVYSYMAERGFPF